MAAEGSGIPIFLKYPKAAGIEPEFCNEEGVMREGGEADGVGEMSRKGPFQSFQLGGGASMS